MALKHLSTICCDYLIRDANGKMSYIGTFRSIISPTLPIIKSPMYVCVEFAGALGDPYKVSVEGNGVNLVMGEGTFLPPATPAVGEWLAFVAAEVLARFETAGKCEIILRSGDEIIQQTSLSLVLQERHLKYDQPVRMANE